VGALLVVAAAVAVFAAYLNATTGPTTAYLVVDTTLEPGTRFSSPDEVQAATRAVSMELPPPVAARAFEASERDLLVGQVVTAAHEPGDLLLVTAIVADGSIPDTQTLSFAIPRSSAVSGALRAGERIDVAATYGASTGAYTAYVVRGIPVVRVTASDGGGIGATGELVLTVAVTSLDDVLALGHAVNTAQVFVSRSTWRPGDDDPARGAYVPAPTTTGPTPDPAAPELGVDPTLDPRGTSADPLQPGASDSSPLAEPDEGQLEGDAG
jgi:hypothetical protein